MDKYYTPQIEDFHVGFEFEFETGIEGWKKFTLENDRIDATLRNVKDFPTQFRVKYLESNDVESLGWKKMIWKFEDKIVEFFGINETGEYLHPYEAELTILKGNRIKISKGEFSQITFIIKNKCELKTLMNQLNITKHEN